MENICHKNKKFWIILLDRSLTNNNKSHKIIIIWDWLYISFANHVKSYLKSSDTKNLTFGVTTFMRTKLIQDDTISKREHLDSNKKDCKIFQWLWYKRHNLMLSWYVEDHNGRIRELCRLLRPSPKPNPRGAPSILLLLWQHFNELAWPWGLEFLVWTSTQMWPLPLWCKWFSPFCKSVLLVIWIIPVPSEGCVWSGSSTSSLYPFIKKSKQFLRMPWS